jgi:hypothetical protein
MPESPARFPTVVVRIIARLVTPIVRRAVSSVAAFRAAVHADRVARAAVWLPLVLLPLLATLYAVVLPLCVDVPAPAAHERKHASAARTPASGAADTAAFEPSEHIDSLRAEEAFLRSRLKLAKTDSIALVINLRDSLVRLECRGTPIRACAIRSFGMSNLLRRMQADRQLADWLRSPFTLREEWASIAKTPIKVKKAPADTTAANSAADVPGPLDKTDVWFTLVFDRGLTVTVSQSERPHLHDLPASVGYALQSARSTIANTLGDLIGLRVPAPAPVVHLRVSRDDATVLYRATPDNLGLALRRW